MEKIPFTVSARTARLIGQENFANADGAVIELVKNSYDADAEFVLVVFDNKSPNDKDNSLYIIDNGDGMSQDIVKNQWMHIGTNNKKIDFTSKKGRIKTGAKGIGRFALDRLGKKTTLFTKSNDSNKGISWVMDWDQFNNDESRSLNDISAEINILENFSLDKCIKKIKDEPRVKSIIRNYDFSTGTIIKIDGLNDDWIPNDIHRLYKGLQSLIPPADIELFEVSLFSLNNRAEFGKVSTAFFNEFDYKVESTFNADNLNLKIKIIRDELDPKRIEKDFPEVYQKIKSEDFPYDLKTIINKEFQFEKSILKVLKWDKKSAKSKLKKVGDFKFTFYFLKRSSNKREEKRYPYKDANYGERKNLLDKFGGVKIYRDSFRVRPYGEPGDDWLDLGKREAASPAGPGQVVGAWRVRSSQIAGSIQVSRISNPNLIDKSDRSSLIENESFSVFKEVVTGIISEFEYDRSKISHPFYLEWKRIENENYNKKVREEAEKLAKEIVETQIEDGKDKESSKEEYEKKFESVFRGFLNDGNEEKEKEEATLRGLASMGIVISSSAHELRGLKNSLLFDIEDLEESINSIVNEAILKKLKSENNPLFIMEGIKEEHKKVQYWLNYALTGMTRDKRTRTNLDIQGYFKRLKKTWINALQLKNINLLLSPKSEEEIKIRAFEIDMDTIFANLISNSIDAFNEYSEIIKRRIEISWSKDGDSDYLVIDYSDNGPGISKVFDNPEEIFTPFVSSKRDEKGDQVGSGLGMYLVKQVVESYKANITIINSNGFKIRIEIPLRN